MICRPLVVMTTLTVIILSEVPFIINIATAVRWMTIFFFTAFSSQRAIGYLFSIVFLGVIFVFAVSRLSLQEDRQGKTGCQSCFWERTLVPAPYFTVERMAQQGPFHWGAFKGIISALATCFPFLFIMWDIWQWVNSFISPSKHS